MPTLPFLRGRCAHGGPMKIRGIIRTVARAGGWHWALGLVLGFTLVAASGGCTRSFYRRAADKEVNDILAEKDKYPEWKIEQFHVYPDPRARFADPCSNPDRPPMPPDDEAAYKLAPRPQQPGRAGVADGENDTYLEIIKAWDAANRAERQAEEGAAKEAAQNVAQAGYRAGLLQSLIDARLTQEQGFLLKLDQAV